MIVEHRNVWPTISESAFVDATAVISGDVSIGANSVVLAGAIISAEGAPVRIGECCIVMECAVLRGAGIHACELQNHVLVGPHAHISGASLGSGCFAATGSVILNGAVLGPGSVVAIHGVVHIGTNCPRDFVVPTGQIAIGDPVELHSANEGEQVMRILTAFGFTKAVFGFDSEHMTNEEATTELCERYSRSLKCHRTDRLRAD